MKLKDTLPEFYKELLELLSNNNLEKILEQLPDLEITGRCDCCDDFCSTFHVKTSRELNIVEQNIIGVKHGETIDLGSQSGSVIIDIDNFGRLSNIEVLDRPDVKKELDKIFKSSNRGRS